MSSKFSSDVVEPPLPIKSPNFSKEKTIGLDTFTYHYATVKGRNISGEWRNYYVLEYSAGKHHYWKWKDWALVESPDEETDEYVFRAISNVKQNNYGDIDYDPIIVHRFNKKKANYILKSNETIKIRYAMAQYLRAEGFRTRFAAKMTFFNMFGIIHPFDSEIMEWWTNFHWKDDFLKNEDNLQRCWRMVFLRNKIPSDAPSNWSVLNMIPYISNPFETIAGMQVYEYPIFENLAFYGNLSNTLIIANYDKIRQILEIL